MNNLEGDGVSVYILLSLYPTFQRLLLTNCKARQQGLMDLELMVFHSRASVLCRRRTREKRRLTLNKRTYAVVYKGIMKIILSSCLFVSG